MNRFKLKEGVHFQDGKKFTKGQVVESPHDLVVLFPQKFEQIGESVPAKGKKTWEDEEEEDVETRKPKPQHVTSAHAPSRTMRDK